MPGICDDMTLGATLLHVGCFQIAVVVLKFPKAYTKTAPIKERPLGIHLILNKQLTLLWFDLKTLKAINFLLDHTFLSSTLNPFKDIFNDKIE